MKPKPIVLATFGGIAPRFGDNLKVGWAKTAENCDLSDGKIRPQKDHLLIEANTTAVNSMFYHEGTWYTGDDKYYLSYPINSNNLLIYLTSGVAYKSVAGVSALLGQDAPDAPTVANATTRKTLTDYSLYEWRESETTDGELYCVLRGTLDNIARIQCRSVNGWTDADVGTGAASTAVTYSTESCLRFLSGNAAAGNLASRYRDLGSIPTKFMVKIRFYSTALGNLTDTDHFQMDLCTAGMTLSVAMATDGLFVYDGAAWNEVGTNVISTGAWQCLTIEVDSTTPASATCKVSLNNTTLATAVDCSYTGAFTDGLITFTQNGSTTANRNTYLDYVYVGDPADPSLAEPDYIKIDGDNAQEGTIGSLAENEWDHGNQDALGFNTIYMNFDPPAATKYNFTLSASGTGEYYIRKRYGRNPDFGDLSYFMVDGIKFTEGSEPGSLNASEFSYGDIDSIGFTTVYFRLSDSSAPESGAHTIKIVTITRRKIIINTTAEDELDVVYELNTGVISGATQYSITLTRNIGGHTDESAPSDYSTSVTLALDKALVTQPTISDSTVTHWSIYRLASGRLLLVTTLPVATTSYEDNTAELDLGDALTTEYTSDQGNIITFAKPPTGLSGLASDVHAGMVFAWYGSTLRWCEPGYPDAWPWHYSMNFPSDIKRVIPLANAIVVLCETGPMRVDGTHPEQLQQSDVLGEEPCIGTAACKTSKGVLYLSDSGLVIFNMLDTVVITDKYFDEEWFTDNVDSTTAVVVEADGNAYLFHSAGTLIYDPAITPPWRTLDTVATAAYKRTDNGSLYILDAEGIKELHGDTTDLSYTWRSGDLVAAPIVDTDWIATEVIGSGTLTLESYVDGVSKATKAMDFTTEMERDRILKLPEFTKGRALQLEFTGTGAVTESKTECSL